MRLYSLLKDLKIKFWHRNTFIFFLKKARVIRND